MTPELFHFRVSHYSEKARWALDRKGWEHRRVDQIAGFHVPRVRWLSGQNRLPVLRLDGRVLHDSTRILDAIERARPDPPLLPADRLERALAIEDHDDEEVAPELRRLFWSAYVDRPADCARMATDGRGALVRLLWRWAWPAMRPLFTRNLGLARVDLEDAHRRLPARLDDLAEAVGPAGFLVGDRFSIADLTAAAVLTAIVRPPGFPYPLPEPWPPALVALRASIADHPACRWVVDLYARERDPSREAVTR